MPASVKIQKNMYLQIMSELLPKVGVEKIEEASREAGRAVRAIGRGLRRIERRAKREEDAGSTKAAERTYTPLIMNEPGETSTGSRFRSHWVGMPDPLLSLALIEERHNDPDHGTYEVYYNVSAQEDDPEPDECLPTLLGAIQWARTQVERNDHVGFTIRVNDVSIATLMPGKFTWQIDEEKAAALLVYEEICNPIDWRA